MFVFPMVGLSSRFFKAGYNVPKYQLPLLGNSVFLHVVSSFKDYFFSDKFVFLCRKDFDTPAFVESELRALGVKDFQIVVFDSETRGQAETVYQGTRKIDSDTEIFVFNIDTIRPGFRKPYFLQDCDGFLEVFSASGENWSFVLPGPNESVIATTEKQRISDFCSDGLYYFRMKKDFDTAFEAAMLEDDRAKGEFYIAPLYNRLIANGKKIRYSHVDSNSVILCGTPEEYEQIKLRPSFEP